MQCYANNFQIVYAFAIATRCFGSAATGAFIPSKSLEQVPQLKVRRRRRREWGAVGVEGWGMERGYPPPQPTKRSGGASWAPPGGVRGGAVAKNKFDAF